MNQSNNLPENTRFEFGNWLRIEPRARSDGYHRGLEARTADPLWFLSRQWQMGEFQGEDAGSPICTQLTYATQTLKSLRLRQSKSTVPINGTLPLEMLVENESEEMNWRMRVQMGQHFERLVWGHVPPKANQAMTDAVKELLATYRTETFAVTETSPEDRPDEDQATQQFRTFMQGRVIDGGQLWEHLKNAPLPKVQKSLVTPLSLAVKEFLTWYETIHPTPAGTVSAWQPEALDYQFEVETSDGARGNMTLKAPDYRNGELDWYTFAIKKGSWPKSPEPRTKVLTPTQITFGGMPHARWWEFEDHAVDFGLMEAGVTDLARLMLMQFGLVYSDDWHIVPLTLPLGSITRIEKLEITDVFGQKTIIPQGITSHVDPLKRFHLYGVEFDENANRKAARFLFLPPAVPFREESTPLEEVRFLRDEGANMVWGVEHIVQNSRGDAVDGFEAQQERRNRMLGMSGIGNENSDRDQDRESKQHLPEYKLASLVPDNWIPFLPIQISPGKRSIKLQRAKMIRNEEKNIPEEIQSMTQILNRQNPRDANSMPITNLSEEAVLRAGVKVQATKQRIRWIDGKTYVWRGRKVVTGRGEGSSGLKFDYLSYPNPNIATKPET